MLLFCWCVFVGVSTSSIIKFVCWGMGMLFGKLYMRRVLESLVQNWRRQTIFGFGFKKKIMFKERIWGKNLCFER